MKANSHTESKKAKAPRIPGITAIARKLGVTHSHLSHVLHGKVVSNRLMSRYKDLLRAERGLSLPLEPGNQLDFSSDELAQQVVAEIGADNCKIRGKRITITAKTVLLVKIQKPSPTPKAIATPV